LYRKSKVAESRLAYLGHLLIENRHGLIADAMATQADGTAERDAGVLMLHVQWKRAPNRRRTVGADKAYDVREFIDLTRELGTTPHVTQNLARPGGSAIDARTTRHSGYAKSQHAHPRIEPAFGWLKTIAWIRKVKLRGRNGDRQQRRAGFGDGHRAAAPGPGPRIGLATASSIPHERNRSLMYAFMSLSGISCDALPLRE
jgi:Transposase DDE domain